MKMGQKLKEQICSSVIFLGANVLEPVANCTFVTVNFEPCSVVPWALEEMLTSLKEPQCQSQP